MTLGVRESEAPSLVMFPKASAVGDGGNNAAGHASSDEFDPLLMAKKTLLRHSRTSSLSASSNSSSTSSRCDSVGATSHASGEPIEDKEECEEDAHIHHHGNNALFQRPELLQQHTNFSKALRKNDPAKLVGFLDRQAMFRSNLGDQFEARGSGVLSVLVTGQMERVSQELRVKKKPFRTGECETTMVYEIGSFFHPVRLVETILWKESDSSPNQLVIEHIRHAVNKPYKDPMYKKSIKQVESCHKKLKTSGSSAKAMKEMPQADASAVLTRISCNEVGLLGKQPKAGQPNLHFVSIRMLPSGEIWRSEVAQSSARGAACWTGLKLSLLQHVEELEIAFWTIHRFGSQVVGIAHINVLEMLEAHATNKSFECQVQMLSETGTFKACFQFDQRSGSPTGFTKGKRLERLTRDKHKEQSNGVSADACSCNTTTLTSHIDGSPTARKKDFKAVVKGVSVAVAVGVAMLVLLQFGIVIT